MERAAKRELVSTLNDVFNTTSVVVVAHYAGLTVADMQKLRAQMKQAGATVKVAKNSLAKIALEGKDVASISGLMKGPTLIAYSSDPVAAPKVAVDFAKGNDKLVILGGAMGTTALNVDGVKALATLPSLDELRGKLVGLIQAPATKIALQGTDVASIGSLLKGPTLIATSSDPVAAPKVAVDFAKGHEKFVLLGGAMGKTALDVNGVKALASLPSLDELRGKLVGLLVAPATKIAQLANAPAGKVARVIQAYASKGEAA